MFSSSVESASYVHVVLIRRTACASLVFRGEAQTTRIATVWTEALGILPATCLSLVVLKTDLEVKVAGVTTSRRRWLRRRADRKQPSQFNLLALYEGKQITDSSKAIVGKLCVIHSVESVP